MAYFLELFETTPSVEASTGGNEYLSTSTMSATSTTDMLTTFTTPKTTTSKYDPTETAPQTAWFWILMIGFIFIIVIFGIALLKQCYRRCRLQFKWSNARGPPGILHPVTPQGLNQTAPTLPTVDYLQTMYHENHDHPPAYDTAIEIDLPSYEEIA